MKFSLKEVVSKFSDALTKIYGSIKETASSKQKLANTFTSRPATVDGAISAGIVRDIKVSQIRRTRMNTRGLPLGYGLHQANAARRFKRSAKAREAATSTQLYAADTFLQDEKACKAARAKLHRPSKFARRVAPYWNKLTLKALFKRIAWKLKVAGESARIPFRRPLKMAKALVRYRPDGAMIVTP
jgi:hypothetical protein